MLQSESLVSRVSSRVSCIQCFWPQGPNPRGSLPQDPPPLSSCAALPIDNTTRIKMQRPRPRCYTAFRVLPILPGQPQPPQVLVLNASYEPLSVVSTCRSPKPPSHPFSQHLGSSHPRARPTRPSHTSSYTFRGCSLGDSPRFSHVSPHRSTSVPGPPPLPPPIAAP